MKAIRVRSGDAGRSRVEPMPLPIRLMRKPIPPEIFRRQANGEQIGMPRLYAAQGLRARRVVGPRTEAQHRPADRHLSFVVSGRIELTGGDGSGAALGPGDVFLEDDGDSGHRIDWHGDCRVLELCIPADWQPEGELPDGQTVERAAYPMRLTRMYQDRATRSRFRGFPELFPPGPDGVTPLRPVTGFHFVAFPPDYFIDWHPEGVNNFVFMLGGALELEVADGDVQTFRAGDVCLAEDRTGEGHIDRAHGLTPMALIVLEDEHLWPVAAAA